MEVQVQVSSFFLPPCDVPSLISVLVYSDLLHRPIPRRLVATYFEAFGPSVKFLHLIQGDFFNFFNPEFG